MFYLVYKKSLDERELFSDESDYQEWEKLLSEYLLPYEIDTKSPYKGLRPYRVKHKQNMNLFGKIYLNAYCLMPTYIYMVVEEKFPGSLTALMRRVTTYYSMLYNKKRKRHGFVFEGSFKKIKLENEEDVVEMIRLVHLQPGQKVIRRFGMVETSMRGSPEEYRYSSYQDYLSLVESKERKWVTKNLAVVKNTKIKDTELGKLPW